MSLISPFSSKAKASQAGGVRAPCAASSLSLCFALWDILILVYPREAIWQKRLRQHVGCGNEELVTDSDERDP